jgi:hypothetical protein
MRKQWWRFMAVVAAVAVWATPAVAQNGASADALMAAASDKLIVEGDVDAAIRLAEQVVSRFAKTERAAAARALLMLGDLHALKGDGEARRTYERLRSEFSDQQGPAGTATRRLRLLAPP